MNKNKPSLSLSTALPVDDEDKARAHILDCALELFCDFGLRRTTMDDVAARAGIGRATLYRRFRDKDLLFQAVIFREVRNNLAVIEQRIKHIESPLEGLLEAFVLAVSLGHKHRLLVRLLTSEPENVLTHLTSGFSKTMAFATHYLAGQIRAAQKHKALSALPATMTAEMLLRLIQSLLLSPEGEIDPSNEESLRQFANKYLRLLLES
ncbi:MAG TPA: helix-turn-helix domain-containing protein [Pseudomonadales bacterium]|nr:helix-turn-helix domain-containing protein [Pseudomonadales bacterium]